MAGAESDISSGRLVANAYRVDALLGQGGMGEVWSASHVATGKRVALKFLKAAVATQYSRRRFLREARAASAVKHPNVVAVHDVIGLEDDVPVLVMDLLVGESLAKKLERERQLSVAETATLLAQVVSAVGTAHELGIVHRDLKPDNVFLCEHETGPPTVKVLDFGIAKLIAVQGDAASTGVLTATGSMLGTPFYMSPEQTFGERDIDHRTDIWSLGVILYECLSGGRPIRGENFGQIFRVITTGSFPAIECAMPGLPEPVARLVGCMLSLQREDRPTDLREVLSVLSQYSTMGVQQFGAPRFNTDPPQSEAQSKPVVVDGTLPVRPDNGGPSAGQATTAPLPLGTSDPHTVSANAPARSLRWRPWLLLTAVTGGACVLAVGLRLLPTSSTGHPRPRAGEEHRISPYPHCRDLLANCGPVSNENCCASSIVNGGAYYRSYDGVTFGNKSYAATTIGFRLDRLGAYPARA